jgi:hypothetical protein
VINTHALFARKVQRKLSNGVAVDDAGRSSSDRKRSRPMRALLGDADTMANVLAAALAEVPAEPSPSCVGPALQLKPCPKFSADGANSRGVSKG